MKIDKQVETQAPSDPPAPPAAKAPPKQALVGAIPAVKQIFDDARIPRLAEGKGVEACLPFDDLPVIACPAGRRRQGCGRRRRARTRCRRWPAVPVLPPAGA